MGCGASADTVPASAPNTANTNNTNAAASSSRQMYTPAPAAPSATQQQQTPSGPSSASTSAVPDVKPIRVQSQQKDNPRFANPRPAIGPGVLHTSASPNTTVADAPPPDLAALRAGSREPAGIDQTLDRSHALLPLQSSLEAFDALVARVKQLRPEDAAADADKLWKSLREKVALLSEPYELPPEDEKGFRAWATMQDNNAVAMARGGIVSHELLFLSPVRLAVTLGISPDLAMGQFLAAVRAGGMSMTFIVMCRSCGGALSTGATLDAVSTAPATCASCTRKSKHSSLNDISVHFAFRNHVVNGAVLAKSSCAPGMKFMMKIKGVVAFPGQGKWGLQKMQLAPGKYELACPLSTTNFSLDVDEKYDKGNALDFRLSSVLANGGVAHFKLHPEFDIKADIDEASFVALLFAQGVNPAEDIPGGPLSQPEALQTETSAALLMNHPEFVEHFRRIGLSSLKQRLSLENITICFSDITSSTQMYSDLGDAVAADRVQDHFKILFDEIAKHRGATVKTIGDAVMCKFLTSADALQAMRLGMERLAANMKPPIELKVGIHTGSVLTLPLNGVNDMLGQDVNVAARVQGQAETCEIVVSGAVDLSGNAMDGLVVKSEEHVKLKGVEGTVPIKRLALVNCPSKMRA